jgi:hypothetical protein
VRVAKGGTALIACIVVVGALAQARPADASMPLVHARGADLRAGGHPFFSYGVYYLGPASLFPAYSFRDPRESHLRRYILGLRSAKGLGANTARIFLQLFDFVHRSHGHLRVRKRALARYSRVLEAAQRMRLHLDVTGNLVWFPDEAPAWYDRMPARERWQVQARFWRAVARVSAPSNAVLCYELTSEPWVAADSDHWYAGYFAGYYFGQYIVRHAGDRDPARLARQWIRTLTAAVHRHDRRHLVGVGLLPFQTGAFAPQEVARALDLLLVHVYPETSQASSAVATVRGFAAQGRPLILGETFMLHDDRDTQDRFLLGSRPYLDGAWTFFNGHGPNWRPRDDAAGIAYHRNIVEFLNLRDQLLAG